MASICIASKWLDGGEVDLTMMHKFSCYKFTNQDLITAEQRILDALDYNVDMAF